MPKQPAAPPDKEAESARRGAEQMTSAISRNVMAALGRPGDLLRVTVHQVTTEGYRVNVVTGTDATSSQIAHSFFVTVDQDGNVTGSSPTIVKHY